MRIIRTTSRPKTNALVLGAVVLVWLLGGAGCAKPNYIPRTKVLDTKLNREVVRVVEDYRRAMERRDAASVLALVHRTYRDQSGTPEADDDLDYDQLKKMLTSRFRRATRIRFQIQYQGIKTTGREAAVDAWIDATFVYEQPQATPKWQRFTDYNRFKLLKDGNTWRFIGGL